MCTLPPVNSLPPEPPADVVSRGVNDALREDYLDEYGPEGGSCRALNAINPTGG